jgi:dynein heavy chain
MKESIVNTTIFIYGQVQLKFKPTPAKSHYTFNLRDVSKIFQGIAKSSGKAIVKEDDMVKLWAHECLRVFQDRLVNQGDRDIFQAMLIDVMKEKLQKDWSKVVTTEPLLFGSFVPLCYPNGDTTLKPYQDVYCEITDREKMSKICNQ